MKSFDFDTLTNIEDKVAINTLDICKTSTSEFVDLLYWIDSEKKNLPIYELSQRGLIKKDQEEEGIFRLFSNNLKSDSPSLYRAGNLKKSNRRNTVISTWQAVVELRAGMQSRRVPKFIDGAIDQDFITNLVKLSSEPYNICILQEMLSDFGIILIIEKAFEGLGIDGVVYKNSRGNPVVALSLRYDRYDNFWFTLCHELSHVVLHYNQLDNVIVEDLDEVDIDEIEAEANYFASSCILDRRTWRKSNIMKVPTEATLLKLSKETQVHPAILAGRYRFETQNYRVFNNIINMVKPSELLKI